MHVNESFKTGPGEEKTCYAMPQPRIKQPWRGIHSPACCALFQSPLTDFCPGKIKLNKYTILIVEYRNLAL